MADKKKAAVAAQEVPEKVQEFVVAQLEEARKRLQHVEAEFVAKGRAQQHEIEALLERVRTGREFKKLKKDAVDATAEVRKRLDAVQGQVLTALGVASSDQVGMIAKELSRLSKRVDSLVKKGPRS